MKYKLKKTLERYLFFVYYYVHIYMQKILMFRKIKNLKSKYLFFSENSFMKKSDTLFVLGSGGSINDIPEVYWQRIKTCDSVGMNFFMIHDFVPDIYSIELAGDLSMPSVSAFIKLLFFKEEQYKKTLFYLKDIWRASKIHQEMPLSMQQRIYIGRDIEIPGETRTGFSKSIRKILKSKTNRSILFKKRASISMWIYYGYLMGYKEIVLCGVDLNGSSSFYDLHRSFYQEQNIPLPPLSDLKIHKTVDPNFGEVTADYVIQQLNEWLLKPNSIKLFVNSTKSILYPSIPIYTME